MRFHGDYLLQSIYNFVRGFSFFTWVLVTYFYVSTGTGTGEEISCRPGYMDSLGGKRRKEYKKSENKGDVL